MASFASDNTSGIHPKVLKAIEAANHGHASSYCADTYTQALNERMREMFNHKDLVVFPVFNGSASNSLALAQMIRPYEAVITHTHSHINADECGMPEFFTGAKLMPHHGDHGKISSLGLEVPINLATQHAPHASRPRCISVSQSTEAGTVYSVEELTALSEIAKKHRLRLHMDGARFANAVASLDCKPSDITTDIGVDILSFGGTKNGAMIAEAVVIFNPELVDDFAYLHKRAGQLASKSRFISAQLLALFEDDLWLDLARHSNNMAHYLRDQLMQVKGVQILYPVEANSVFVNLPPRVAQTLHEKGHEFYAWPLDGVNAHRLVTAFTTTKADIDDFIADCHKGAT